MKNFVKFIIFCNKQPTSLSLPVATQKASQSLQAKRLDF